MIFFFFIILTFPVHQTLPANPITSPCCTKTKLTTKSYRCHLFTAGINPPLEAAQSPCLFPALRGRSVAFPRGFHYPGLVIDAAPDSSLGEMSPPLLISITFLSPCELIPHARAELPPQQEFLYRAIETSSE